MIYINVVGERGVYFVAAGTSSRQKKIEKK
jgi:hypothetical protein